MSARLPLSPQTRRVLARVVHKRAEGDRLYVTGIGYLALDPPEDGSPISPEEAALRIDSWDTYMRLETLRTLAHRYLEYGRRADSQHDRGVIGDLVESHITREGDPQWPAAAWVVTVKVSDPAVIAAVEAGELTGFSIEVLSRIKKAKVAVEGEDAPRAVGELTDCYPLFLSLVDAPAIDQPFTEITRAQRSQGDASPGVRLVRCAPPPPEDDPMTDDAQKTDAPTPTTTEAKASTTPTGGGTAPSSAPAPAALSARAQRRLEAVRRVGAETPELVQRVEKVIARADGTSFAEVWAAVSEHLELWNTAFDALNVLQSVFWNIRWDVADVADQRKLVLQATQECATALAKEFAEEGAEDAEGAQSKAKGAETARAGKALSKANMDRLRSIGEHCRNAHEAMQSMIADHADEEEGEEAKSARSAPVLPSSTEAVPAPAVPGLDALEQRIATVEKNTAAARAEAGAEAEARAKAEQSRDAALSRAAELEKRIAELEAARPAPRSGGEPEPAAPSHPAGVEPSDSAARSGTGDDWAKGWLSRRGG